MWYVTGNQKIAQEWKTWMEKADEIKEDVICERKPENCTGMEDVKQECERKYQKCTGKEKMLSCMIM